MGYVGERIRKLRLERGLTQEELAAKSGKYVTQISNYERGKSLPSLPSRRQLATALGVTPDDFLPKVGNQSTTVENIISQGNVGIKGIIDEFQRRLADATGLAPENVRIRIELNV